MGFFQLRGQKLIFMILLTSGLDFLLVGYVYTLPVSLGLIC
jgi:hypothetical protein